MTNPNWNWRPLGELFDIGAGKTMSAAARAGADKVPFLRTSNVLWDEIDLTQVDEMSISPTELVDKSLKAGDLLVCEGGEIGRAAVWDGRVPVMSFQNHLHRLRPIQDDVDARFYVYFLQSAFTQLGIFEGAGSRDNMRLFEACAQHLKPLEFFGRYDHTVAVDPAVLNWLLDKASPNFDCKLVPDNLHAKVIWWMDAGA